MGVAEVMPIHLVQGDITAFEADAIVNAANSSLLPGGGVSGAIHSAGGAAIAAECHAHVSAYGNVTTGAAIATTAGNLKAKKVVHAVGPVWKGGDSREAELLAEAYERSVQIADWMSLKTIAFPSISTGIFGYPVEEAAPIAVRAVRDALTTANGVTDATFVLYDPVTYAAYAQALAEIGQPAGG